MIEAVARALLACDDEADYTLHSHASAAIEALRRGAVDRALKAMFGYRPSDEDLSKYDRERAEKFVDAILGPPPTNGKVGDPDGNT